MKKPYFLHKTTIGFKKTESGESIEEMLRRITANKEPIPDNVPPIYTERSEGVIADYDIRTDRFDVAMQAQDKFARSKAAKGAELGSTTETSTDADKENVEQPKES